MDSGNIAAIVEYIWIPIVTALVLLWRRFTGIDTRTQLLEQSKEHHEQQRLEERKLRDAQRSETHHQIDSHHKTVMTKLDGLETRIKNGQ